MPTFRNVDRIYSVTVSSVWYCSMKDNLSLETMNCVGSTDEKVGDCGLVHGADI